MLKSRNRIAFSAVLVLIAAPFLALAMATPAAAAPVTVSVSGDFQTELGCASDFDPLCPFSQLVSSYGGSGWVAYIGIPPGTWTYNIVIDGVYAPLAEQRTFTLATVTVVTFFYSDIAHRFSSTAEDPLVTATGDFQSELGCPFDFDPACPRTWLFSDGTGRYSAVTPALPSGSYGSFAAHDLSNAEIYGLGGLPGGLTTPFTVAAPATVVFSYDLATHVLTIESESPTVGAGSASVALGATLSGVGRGYLPGEPITLSFAGASAGTVTADQLGRFAYSLVVPGVTPLGSADIIATGGTSARSATQPVTVITAAVPAPAAAAAPAAVSTSPALAATGTGVDTTTWVLVGLVLLLSGGGILARGRWLSTVKESTMSSISSS